MPIFTTYADDTSLAYDTGNVAEAIPFLNSELLKVFVWLRKIIYLLKPRPLLTRKFPSVCVENSALGGVDESSYLGVISDPHLTFGPYIHSVTIKQDSFVSIG